MDTAAQRSERDRSPHRPATGPVPEPEDPGERSRSVSPEPVDPPGVPAAEAEGTGPGDRRPPLAEWLPGGRLTLAVLILLALLLLVTTFVLKPFAIPSSSMEPGLRSGDRVLVNKLAYLGSEPQRGDVVVFDGTGYFGDADYIKRVIGTGGDRVVCCDRTGRIEVNGRAVDEPYLRPGDRPSRVPFDVVVPPERLFLLGDHRSASSDSRDHLGRPGGGMVPQDAVIGRAEWITWPFGRLTGIDRPDGFARVPAPAGDGHG
ncbi:signal peptidase I [Streptomyces sp. NPDC002454]|uniref:signal peptidase I n=1 Tax=Streptomyces sp. NPDC002490 TaxID=3154416 RepID=UPI00331FEC43